MLGRISHPPRITLLATLALSLSLTVPAAANPTPGFVEDWPGTSIQDWTGGSIYANPGTGGVGGVGDGFLTISTLTAGRLGAFGFGPEYTGNWTAGGVTELHLWLNDVGPAQALQMHFSIGNSINFWQYNEAFVPLPGVWKEFVVDLTDASKFTRIIGTGTFAAALSAVDRIHIRHDLAPYVQTPDTIQGEVGLDRIDLRGVTTAARTSTWGRIKALYGSASPPEAGRRK